MNKKLKAARESAQARRERQRPDTAAEAHWIIQVAFALLDVRDSRLYREKFETFEDYCQQRLGLSRQRASQLIQAAEVAQNLSTIVDIQPTRESQARPLVNLSPEEQRRAWQIATSNNATPNRAEVGLVVETIRQLREAGVHLKP